MGDILRIFEDPVHLHFILCLHSINCSSSSQFTNHKPQLLGSCPTILPFPCSRIYSQSKVHWSLPATEQWTILLICSMPMMHMLYACRRKQNVVADNCRHCYPNCCDLCGSFIHCLFLPSEETKEETLHFIRRKW